MPNDILETEANNQPEPPGSRYIELPTDTQGRRQLLNPCDGGRF